MYKVTINLFSPAFGHIGRLDELLTIIATPRTLKFHLDIGHREGLIRVGVAFRLVHTRTVPLRDRGRP